MGRRGVPPLTGKVFQIEGADVERARGSAFSGIRGRRPISPTGQHAQTRGSANGRPFVGMRPNTGRLVPVRGMHISARGSLFSAYRGRGPAGPTGQRAQASTPDAPSNNTFTSLADSDSREDTGFHGPGGPSSDAPDMSGSGATESETPNAPGSSPDAGWLDSSGGIDTLGNPTNINDDDQPDTTIQQLLTDAKCLRQQIDRKQAKEEAERQAEEEDDEIRRQLLEELRRACNKNVFEEKLVVEHDGIDHDIM